MNPPLQIRYRTWSNCWDLDAVELSNTLESVSILIGPFGRIDRTNSPTRRKRRNYY